MLSEQYRYLSRITNQKMEGKNSWQREGCYFTATHEITIVENILQRTLILNGDFYIHLICCSTIIICLPICWKCYDVGNSRNIRLWYQLLSFYIARTDAVYGTCSLADREKETKSSAHIQKELLVYKLNKN